MIMSPVGNYSLKTLNQLNMENRMAAILFKRFAEEEITLSSCN
jgi:hypothetical protein